HFRAALLDPFAHSIDLMRTQIVHYDDVAHAQFWAQAVIQISEEDVAVGGLLDGHCGDDSACAECPQNGQHLPATVGRSFADASSAETARIEPRHRRGHTTFVQKNQAFRRDRAYFCNELFASLLVDFGVALGGVE